MTLLRKDAPGSAPGDFIWEGPDDVVDVPPDLAHELLRQPDGGFHEVFDTSAADAEREAAEQAAREAEEQAKAEAERQAAEQEAAAAAAREAAEKQAAEDAARETAEREAAETAAREADAQAAAEAKAQTEKKPSRPKKITEPDPNAH